MKTFNGERNHLDLEVKHASPFKAFKGAVKMIYFAVSFNRFMYYYSITRLGFKQGFTPEGGGERAVVSPPIGEKFLACRGIFNGKISFYVKKDTLYFWLFSPPIGEPSPPSGKSWRHPWIEQ